MKVLVTGCAGFIGSNLSASLLSEKIGVVGIDSLTGNYDVRIKKRNLARLKKSSGFRFIKASINDPSTFARLKGSGITHIAHLGARTGVRDSTKYPEEYLSSNILGTLNVLEFARSEEVKKIVAASTSSVYGDNPLPFVETQKISTPLSIYAASKIGMEALLRSFHEIHGLPITVLRFFTVYGPSGRPDMVVYRFMKNILQGKPIIVYGDGTTQRDFTYVTDVVAGIRSALQPGPHGTGYNVFNIANHDSRSLNELIALIEKYMGKKAKQKHLPMKKEDISATLADISKAQAALGFSPKVRLEEGIKKTVEWYLKDSK